MTVLRFTLIALLTLIFVGCSSETPEVDPSPPIPTPNIEATIEARLVEERLIDDRIAAEVKAQIEVAISEFLQQGTVIAMDSGIPSSEPVAAEQTPLPEAIDVDMLSFTNEIVRDNETNSIAAKAKYSGMVIRTEGKVGSLLSHDDGDATVIVYPLVESSAYRVIYCEVQEESQKEYLMTLSTDQSVVIEGLISEFEVDTFMGDSVSLRLKLCKVTSIPEDESSAITTPVASEPEAVDVDMLSFSNELFELVAGNPLAADAKYTGMVIRSVGIIAAIRLDSIFVAPSSEYQEPGLFAGWTYFNCTVSSTQIDDLINLSSGERITIEGKVNDFSYMDRDVNLEPCSFALITADASEVASGKDDVLYDLNGIKLLDFALTDLPGREYKYIEASVQNNDSNENNGAFVCFQQYDENDVLMFEISSIYADNGTPRSRRNLQAPVYDVYRVELLGLSLFEDCSDLVPSSSSESESQDVTGDITCSEDDNFTVTGTVSGFPDGTRVIGKIAGENIVVTNVSGGAYELVLDMCDSSFENEYMQFQVGGQTAEQQVIVMKGATVERPLTLP